MNNENGYNITAANFSWQENRKLSFILFIAVFAIFGVVALLISSASTEGVTVKIVARGNTGQEQMELRVND